MTAARPQRRDRRAWWLGILAAVGLFGFWYTSTIIEVTLRNPRSEPVPNVRVRFGRELVHGPVAVAAFGQLEVDLDTDREDVLFVTWTGDGGASLRVSGLHRRARRRFDQPRVRAPGREARTGDRRRIRPTRTSPLNRVDEPTEARCGCPARPICRGGGSLT